MISKIAMISAGLCRRGLGPAAVLTAFVGAAAAQGTGGHSLRQIVAQCGPETGVTTGAHETAEVILPDGTSVLVAPGAMLTARCAADGSVTVQLSRGLMRISSPAGAPALRIITSQSAMALVAASAVVEVDGEGTRAQFLNGRELRVTSGPSEQVLYRAGFQVHASGTGVSNPRRASAGEMVNDILRLSDGLRSGTRPRVIGGRAEAPRRTAPTATALAPARSGGDRAAQLRAGDEIGKGNVLAEGPAEPEPPVTPEPVMPTMEVTANAGGFGSLTPSVGPPAVAPVETVTSISVGFLTLSRQTGPGAGPFSFTPIFGGPTTNRIFAADDLTVAIGDDSDIAAIGEQRGGVSYYFGSSTFGVTERNYRSNPATLGDQESNDRGLIRFPRAQIFPETGSPQGVITAQSGYPTYLGLIQGSRLPPYQAISISRSQDGSGHSAYSFSLLESNTTFGEFVSPSVAVFDGDWTPNGRAALMSGLLYDIPIGQGSASPGYPVNDLRADSFMLMDMAIVRSVNWLKYDCGTACEAEFTAYIQDLQDQGFELQAPAEYHDVVVGVFERGQDGHLPPSPATTVPGGLGAAYLADPTRPERYVYATGELNQIINHPTPGARIDRFYLSAGMSERLKTGGITGLTPGMDSEGGRAFLRASTWTELAGGNAGFSLAASDLVQSGLFAVYSDAAVIGEDAQSPRLFHADLALRGIAVTQPDGTTLQRQVSTISATIGKVRFRTGTDLDGARMGDAILDLATIGSSRGLNADGTSASAVLSFGDVASTAAGGGNPNLGTGGVADPGRLGFFVLENTGTIFDDVEARAAMTGGIERSFDPAAADNRFALLRLGVATGSAPLDAQRDSLSGVVGYAVSIDDVATTGGVALAFRGTPDLRDRGLNAEGAYVGLQPNLRFSDVDTVNNSFLVTLDGLEMGERLGSNAGRSAYVDRKTYGARSAGAGMALISGDPVAAGVSADLATATGGYQHVKWGFFMGDAPAAGDRRHTHLGTWAGGRPLSAADAAVVTRAAEAAAAAGRINTATVTYNGHAIGNVSAGGQVYTATGTYSDSFNFASRTGTITMEFDGRSITGTSASPASLQGYTGSLAGAGLVGEVNGRFASPVVTVGGSGFPAPGGMFGAFGLAGTGGSDYRAAGSFAAEAR